MGHMVRSRYCTYGRHQRRRRAISRPLSLSPGFFPAILARVQQEARGHSFKPPLEKPKKIASTHEVTVPASLRFFSERKGRRLRICARD